MDDDSLPYSRFHYQCAEKLGKRPDALAPPVLLAMVRFLQFAHSREPEVKRICRVYSLGPVLMERFAIPFLKGVQYVEDHYGDTADAIRLSEETFQGPRHRAALIPYEDRSSFILIHPSFIAGVNQYFNRRQWHSVSMPDKVLTGEETAFVTGVEEAHHAYWVRTHGYDALKGREIPKDDETPIETAWRYNDDPLERAAMPALYQALEDFRKSRQL
ncbi:MAG: hypothetical protein K2Q12_07155 [Rickettsiales bacterium]|nr:hypothetical protein [Rickettsiales bacterium]